MKYRRFTPISIIHAVIEEDAAAHGLTLCHAKCHHRTSQNLSRMGAGTVIFEGVRRKPKRNRGPQKARSAEICNSWPSPGASICSRGHHFWYAVLRDDLLCTFGSCTALLLRTGTVRNGVHILLSHQEASKQSIVNPIYAWAFVARTIFVLYIMSRM